jgi:hypothetical protein
MSSDVKSYEPPIPIEDVGLRAGFWILLNEQNLVALSAPTAERLIEEAKLRAFDLAELPIEVIADEDEEALLFFDL